jgi:radical SAM protein with 4Fe4S-binding SPASM domain
MIKNILGSFTTFLKKCNMNKDYNNFCVAPWMHLHVINDGRAFACCQTPLKDENSFGNVKSQKLIEIVNSDKAKQMRKDMLEGKPLPSACERCTSKEAVGLNSMRTGFNDKWYDEVKDSINSTAEDGTVSKLQLTYWDFRFSNYCNLACTTCSPLFSTQWADDWIKLHPGYDKYSDTRLIDLEKASIFWDDIAHNLDYMKEIHFAGGEPLMMPEHWRILKLLDEKQKYDVALRYSTNGTTLGRDKDDVLSYWKKFKYVHLSLSIDGEGDAFEYIRYKGKWKSTFENLKRIRESGAVDYWFHPTVSILNIFRLTELHEVLHKADLMPLKSIHKNRGFNIENYWVDRFHLNPLFTPDYYSITVLPASLKEQAADKITKYGKKLEADTGIPFSGWQNIIDFMYSEDRSILFEKFKWKSQQIDTIRSNDVFAFNPELK